MEDRYLGDGVYARFDGQDVWLDLRGQKKPLEPLVEICLDNQVRAAFLYYINDLHDELGKIQTKEKRDHG